MLALTYERLRPRIERQVGRVMGHPLRLGPYRGFGPDGLVVGPSRFLAGAGDASTVQVEEVRMAIDPITSWRRRTWILDFSLRGAQVDLRRNARGWWWELGRLPPGPEPPRLDLTFRVLEPGRLRLHGLGATPGAFALSTSGEARLQTHQRAIDLTALVRRPGQPGSVRLEGWGRWRERQWRARIVPRALSVAALQPLLPRRGALAPIARGALEGRAEGRFNLDLVRGRASCSGQLRLRDLRWRPRPGGEPLAIATLPLRCQDQSLTLAPSDWRYADWRGIASGRVSADRRLLARILAQPPARHPLGSEPLVGELQGDWSAQGLRVGRFNARLGRSSLQLAGRLGSRLDLDGTWRFDPRDLPATARLPAWISQRPLAGALALLGTPADPVLRLLSTDGPAIPMLGPTRGAVRWQGGVLALERIQAPGLEAQGRLPLAWVPGRGLVQGPLDARLTLSNLPLARLGPAVGTTLQGRLDAWGRLHGPLNALRPDLALRVQDPAAGPLRLPEVWQGRFRGEGLSREQGGGRLSLHSLEPALPARLEARFDSRWTPVAVALDRDGGQLRLDGTPAAYRWQARAFPLRGLELLLGKPRRFRPLEGLLAGQGSLSLQPLAFAGRAEIGDPLLLGLSARRLQADVRYRDRDYRLQGEVEIASGTRIGAQLNGRWDGPFQARLQGRGLDTTLFQQLSASWPSWLGQPLPVLGRAADLGAAAIETFGGSLDGQLQALDEARASLAQRDQARRNASRAERLGRLQARFDTDVTLRGPDFGHVQVSLEASGHLWEQHEDRDRALATQPVMLRLEGPLGAGSGDFDVGGLPLALLTLLTPVPETLRGNLRVQGRYRFGQGRPALSLDLALQEASLGRNRLALERGRVELQGESLALDLALRGGEAFNSVDLSGVLPLDRRRDDLELRLASRGDGLRFLTDLTGQALEWNRGSADLQLLVRGSLVDPIANGFLRLRGGECRFIGQTLRGIEATVLFDFEQMLVQELRASVGRGGRISGKGRIGLVRPLSPDQSLALVLRAVPFSLPRIRAVGDGRLTLGGSLRAPEMGGELAISRGSINAQPGELGRAAGGSAPRSGQTVEPVSINQLLESRWDFREPLVLMGPDVESPTGESLRQAIPQVPWLAFEGLRLSFGPDLRVVVPRVANFRIGGALRIGGRLDSSLQASGVVRLLGGRLNLFTTSFSLDPDAPNVAIFTPSLGLVPFLDIAMRTRVSDSLRLGASSGEQTTDAATLSALESMRGQSSFDPLKLILVTVSVSGPADRLAENLRLRSSPPLPESRLVALIGGNSLAGLNGGAAGTALATVVGQSLLSPLLGTLSDALGRRVSLALYPTYVSPSVDPEREIRSGRVPPQLVFGSEVGLDITDRLNLSVLAAPNRSDIPPQINLKYKASESINIEGSVDTQGAWQTLLQLFFRF
ncbi:MAG: translocation/assembly module TamB domain-containing protein [Cyanobacteriota bacterium]|nr:translocation/assembly module TamB domain-containing protein [Cyanobacteriota bacterium]